MGLAWRQAGRGLHARSGEAKFNKSQSMANPALSRALLGHEWGTRGLGEESRQLPSAAPSLVLRMLKDGAG